MKNNTRWGERERMTHGVRDVKQSEGGGEGSYRGANEESIAVMIGYDDERKGGHHRQNRLIA
jgi:hypothetical protein